MHYIFLDEKYSEEPGYRTIIVSAWAVNQNTLNNNSEQLDLPVRAPLEGIVAALDNLAATGYVGRARLARSVFRPGEVDGCDDVPRMARTNTVWSMAMVFAVARALFDTGRSGHLIDLADLYFDDKSLTREHRVAWEETFRSLLVREARRFASQARIRSLENVRIRRIEFVPKARSGDPNKFQRGVGLADALCFRSGEIAHLNPRRISQEDISDVLERTVSQYDGIPFEQVR